MNMSQDIHRMIKELKQDEEHYAQRTVVLSPHQHLLVIGQFHAAMTPVSFEEDRFQLSFILPRQSMMLCTDRPEIKPVSLINSS